MSGGLLAALIVSLGLAAFAALSETALTSVSRIWLRARRADGDLRAAAIERLHQDPNAYLGAILMANTVAVIVASAATTLLAVQAFGDPAAFWATVGLSLVVLVLCEIGPKSYALAHNEQVARWVVGPVTLLARVLHPVIWLLTRVTGLLTRAVPGSGVPRGPFLSEEDLKTLVAVGHAEGVVEQEEREMIHGVLEMTDKAVREVMVPRVEMIALEAERTVDEAVQLVLVHGHSRIPVYRDTVDNVVGVVYAKDLLRARARQAGSGDGLERPAAVPTVADVARPAYFTPEAKRLGELLHEMQRGKVHLAVVVDEYGGTAGLITIEDLIEEIVGPIRDEYDQAEEDEVQFLGPSEVRLSARIGLDDVNELLHLTLSGEDFDSIGGLVYARLGRIPKVGDTVALTDAVTLTVESVERQSIRTVRLQQAQPFLPEAAAPDAGPAVSEGTHPAA